MTEVLRAELNFDDAHVKDHQAGDVVFASLKIYPLSLDQDQSFEWLKKDKALFEKIQILKIINPQRNENNPEVLEANILLAVKGKISPREEIYIESESLKVNLILDTKFSYAQNISPGQSFKIIESKSLLPESHLSNFAAIGFVTVLLAICAYIISRQWKKKKTRNEQLKIKKIKKKELLELVHKAAKREEFESLYQNRKNIEEFFNQVKTKKEFMEAINTSQYKDQWDEGDFKKIKNYQRIFLEEIERGI